MAELGASGPRARVIVNPRDNRAEWTHGNAVAELPDGNLVVSFRLISTVLIVERRSGRMLWKLGPPILNNQHAPAPLANCHLLIFDNGTHRLDHHLPYSQVIEVDPATGQTVWCYQDRPPTSFFSPLVPNAQRLPNGNTLICEAGSAACSRSRRQARWSRSTSARTSTPRRPAQATRCFGPTVILDSI